MLKKLLVICLFLSTAACSSLVKYGNRTFSGDLEDLKLELDVRKKILPNGMKVIIAENRKLPIVSVYTFMDIGGKYEGKNTTGATHFLEHMLFKRSKNYPPGFFFKYIESNGGRANAYTSFDNTVYHEDIPSSTLSTVLDLEADRMGHLVLDPDDFEKERKVVLEERKMRYENSPNGQKFLKTMQTIFKGTPYGGSVIGSKEDLLNLKREKMLEFYNRFYVPNNAILVIVGDVNIDYTMKLVEEKFGKIKRNQELEVLKKKLDNLDRYKGDQKQLPLVKKIQGESVNPIFSLVYPSVKIKSKHAFTLDFLSYILSSGVSSYLSKEYVVGKYPKLSSVSAFNYTLMNSGAFFVSGELLSKVNLNKFRHSLKKSIYKFCDDGIKPRDVEKTKNMLLVAFYSQVRTNSGLAGFLGRREFFYGDYMNYLDELSTYNSMTVQKLQKVCLQFLKPEKTAFLSVWSKHKKRKGE